MDSAPALCLDAWRRRMAALAGGGAAARAARRVGRGGGAGGESDEQVLAALFALQSKLARELLRLAAELALQVEPGMPAGGDGAAATLAQPWLDLPFGAPDGRPSALATNLLEGELDALQEHFQRLVPRAVRKPLGQYHTPSWLAEEMIAMLPNAIVAHGRLLDPGCGSGVFLRAALRRRQAQRPGATARELLAGLVGFDLDPLAVLIARVNLLLDLRRLGIRMEGDLPAPIRWGDSVLALDGGGAQLAAGERFDVLVGNPPWVGWDSLSSRYRAQVRELLLARWELFTRRGFETCLGFANDDVLHVFTTATIEHFLRPGGELLYLVKQTLFHNETGEDFRRFCIRRADGGERKLRVLAVHDLRAAGKLFEGAASETAIVHLRDGEETRFPVRWFLWRGRRGREELSAAPSEDNPRGPWIVRELARATAALEGENAYASEIRHGLKHDAEGVFSVRILAAERGLIEIENRPGRGRRALAPHRAWIEPDRVFPYLKSRHMRRYGLSGWFHVLIPQERAGEDNEAFLRARLPRTYAWLEHHRAALAERRSSIYRGRPFYSIFGLGPYTWKPHRLVWCGMAHRPAFAVVSSVEDPHLGSKLIVPDGAHYTVALEEEEAHFLCALLNCARVRTFLDARGGHSKRSLTKSLLARLAVPLFNPSLSEHRALVALSRAAHARAARGEALDDLDAEIDRCADAQLARSRRRLA